MTNREILKTDKCFVSSKTKRDASTELHSTTTHAKNFLFYVYVLYPVNHELMNFALSVKKFHFHPYAEP